MDVHVSPRSNKGPVFTGRAPLASVPETKETPPNVPPQKQELASVIITEMPAGENDMPTDFYLSELYAQLCSLLNTNPDRFNEEEKGLFCVISD